MIYRIKLVSDEVNNFYRVIEIDSDGTFRQLREAILDSVGYSHDCIDSFAICNDAWEPQEEIVLEDLGLQSSDRDVYLMDSTTVSELMDEEGQKLVFIFDNLNERAFFMELKEIKFGESPDVPKCTMREGEAPEQEEVPGILQDLTKPQKDTTVDLFADFGIDEAGEGYDDDDFDSLEEKDSLD